MSDVILYDQHEKDFETNGIGILDDILKCTVTEVRNGKFELDMEYPIQGNYSQDLVQNNYILAKPNDFDDPHAFRIYEIDKDLEAGKIIVKAVTKIEELMSTVVMPFSVENRTPEETWYRIREFAVDPIYYDFKSNILTRGNLSVDSVTNVLSLLNGKENSLTKNIGGELKYSNKRIQLFTVRGRQNVTTIRPRKNLKNIKITTNMSGKYTRILPYAKYTPEGANQKEVTVYGDIVKSDHYDDYSVKRIVAIDISSKFNEYKAQQKQLRKDKIASERTSNKAADADKRRKEESARADAEAERERQRRLNFETQKQKRQEARAAALAKRGGSSGGRRTKSQIEADRQSRYQASDAAYERRQSELERKFNEQETKRASAKQSRLQKKAEREAEKARRAERMANIKEETKVVITKEMVNAEAATYFDDNPRVDLPNIKVEVDMIAVSDTTEYEHKILKSLNDIRLCDTVDVYVPKLDVDITVKIIEVQYDCLSDRILKIVASTEENLPGTLLDSQRNEYKEAAKNAVNESMSDINSSINTVLDSANGKNKNYYGPDEPVSEDLKENDLWFKDVGEGLVDMYRYDGTQWILVSPNNLNEVLEEQINSIVDEVSGMLDEYRLETDTIFGELSDTTIDAMLFLSESKESIDAELNSAKSKIQQIENDFNASKKYLNDRIVELSQGNIDKSRAILTEVQKQIQEFERGIRTTYSQLRVGTNNILRGAVDMPVTRFKRRVFSDETLKLYSRELKSILVVNGSPVRYSDLSNDLKPDQRYTLSFYVKLKGTSPSNMVIRIISPPAVSSTYSANYVEGSGMTVSKQEWERVHMTFIAGRYDDMSIEFNIDCYGSTPFLVSGFQLEESTILSDWHPNTSEIEENFAKYQEGIDGRLTLLQTTVGNLDINMSKITTKVEELPGKITLQVDTAKEELKQFTTSQIRIAEDRISSNVTSNINGLISSSVTQSSGVIRQAITSANDATKSYAQSIVQQEASARQISLTQINDRISDYNIVRERVNLFSRTLGTSDNDVVTKISNMVMTNESFQTMISNVDARSSNLIRDTDSFKSVKLIQQKYLNNIPSTPGVYGNINEYIIDTNNIYTPWAGFTLPMTINKLVPGVKYTFRCKLTVYRFHSGYSSTAIQLKNHETQKGVAINVINKNDKVDLNVTKTITRTITVNDIFELNNNSNSLPFYVWVYGNAKIGISDIMLVEGDKISPNYKANNTDTFLSVLKQLNDSYAINILNGSRELITEINANKNGIRLKGNLIELDGTSVIHNGIIQNAMIADGAINKAKIANASINDAHINNLNSNKVTGLQGSFEHFMATTGSFGHIFTKGITIGDTTMTFANGKLDILRKNSTGVTTTDNTIRSNGRYSGPTIFNGSATSSIDYVPVMTNLHKNYPLSPYNGRSDISVYGVRAMFLVTFYGQTNEYGTSSWLYVNDGSSQNNTWYVPMKKANDTIGWHYGFTG